MTKEGNNRSDWANNKFPFSIWDYLMMKFERIQLGCNWAVWRRTFRNLSTLTSKSIVRYNSSNLLNNNMNGLVICWNTSTWNMSTMIYKWHFEEKRTERQCDSKATFFLSPTVLPAYLHVITNENCIIVPPGCWNAPFCIWIADGRVSSFGW